MQHETGFGSKCAGFQQLGVKLESESVSHSVMSDSLQPLATPCNPMDCSPSGSSVHGILQTRILEWVAIPFSGNLPNPGIKSGLLHCKQILYHLSHQGSPQDENCHQLSLLATWHLNLHSYGGKIIVHLDKNTEDWEVKVIS